MTYHFIRMSKTLIFHNGDDYSIWKLKVLGVLAGKLDSYGLDMEFDEWSKVNKGVVKKESEKEAYNLVQVRGLMVLWRYLDDGIIKKLGNVNTIREAFQKLDEI